jgi:hypothetical protein
VKKGNERKTLDEIIELADGKPLTELFYNKKFEKIDVGILAEAIKKDKLKDPKLCAESIELLYKICLSHIAHNEKEENYDKILSSATPELFSYLFKKTETNNYVMSALEREDDFLKEYFFKALTKGFFYYARTATEMLDSKEAQENFLKIFKDTEEILIKRLENLKI